MQVPQPQSTWDKVKAFFSYSATIFVARLTAFSGLITAVIGAMDWAPLAGLNVATGFNKNQIIWLGGLAAFQGLTVELARRRTLGTGA